MVHFFRAVALTGLFALAPVFAEPLSYYFEQPTSYHSKIPTPKAVLGFDVGDRHVRHDQLVHYFKELADASNQVRLLSMGYTTESRQQVLATISSTKNLNNLEQILANRRAGKNQNANDPVVVWLGYSIHGNEISGSHASMLTAYYLAAAQTEEIKQLLDDVIILIEPSMNPDGMDRFVTWVNTNRGTSLNTDPEHREHQLQWPSGRTNHFMFDLNRDWLPLTQVESRNRVKYFHQFKPNVLGDFHEMGKDSSYFFQPGIPSRTNPLTPKTNIELTQDFARYHGEALDADHRLYFSRESFDDYYYGKGSTYPDINGAVGILFEQASSRGAATTSDNGVLTFGFGIKNHVLTSFSTLKAAQQNKKKLHQFRTDFYAESVEMASDADFSGYLLHEPADRQRLKDFLRLLEQHQIQSYALTDTYQSGNTKYRPGSSYYVPLEQPQYRLIKTIFEQVTEFKDNSFYDVSGWTLSLAYNLDVKKINRARDLDIDSEPFTADLLTLPEQNMPLKEGAYAYVFSWDDYLAPKLLNALLNQGIKAKVATKDFTLAGEAKNEELNFSAGSIVILSGLQNRTDWFDKLMDTYQQYHIDMVSLTTGLSLKGIDLGSSSMVPLAPVKVMMIGGHSVSQYEAGHMLYYLDDTLGVPVSVIDDYRLSKIDFNAYTHIIMVDGTYKNIGETTLEKIETWVKNGGVIYAQKRASKWLASKNILQSSFVSDNELQRLFNTDDLTYADKQQLAAKKRIAGTIFATDIDVTHPLAYGYQNPRLPIFKNSTVIMEKASRPFVTLAQFTEKPLLSGYSDDAMVGKVAENTAITAHNVGKGRVIASTENLVFRGYWHGTAKIVANAVFFPKAFSVPVKP
ncbi:M14 metallopeptidase family protein [Thalassotalea litorea]|uniref:M14 metallopeptidase family protein n=1 Tax=Thalassotalea litorea TaxID=2020715 RepID=UPI001FE268F4|nr:M14 metallopeptidase family protein [Thalassotalea litorea]